MRDIKPITISTRNYQVLKKLQKENESIDATLSRLLSKWYKPY
ncbi:MAG: hypothetical protein ACTSUV_05140 [Candidatus Ranarchaeia archaeon]